MVLPMTQPPSKSFPMARGRDNDGRVHHAHRRQVNKRPVFESWCGLVNPWLHTVQLEAVSKRTPLSCLECIVMFQ